MLVSEQSLKKGHLLFWKARLPDLRAGVGQAPRVRVKGPVAQRKKWTCPWPYLRTQLLNLSWLTSAFDFSSKKREGELTVAQGRVKDLESLFHRSEAELAAALSDKHSLESDVAELRAQLAKVGPGQFPF